MTAGAKCGRLVERRWRTWEALRWSYLGCARTTSRPQAVLFIAVGEPSRGVGRVYRVLNVRNLIRRVHSNLHSRGDDGDVDDVLDGAAAGKVHHRFAEALDKRADRGGSTNSLRDLIADVAAVEIWEYENIGRTGDRRIGGFALTDFRNERCVEL